MIAVIKFLGTNCELDVCHAIKVAGGKPELVFFTEENLDNYSGAVIPGGFSYGDYLRAGAIASKMPVIKALRKMVDEGKPVLGICNGAQIGLEAGFSRGTLTNNINSRFICKWVYIRVENNKTPFTKYYKKGEVLKIPIAHAEGRFFADDETLDYMYRKKMIVFKYCDETGEVREEVNPNGSIDNIAGVCNENFNCLLLMPHPERASEKILGSDDGLRMFKGMIE
ncbi:phosphoribosylformylglycinamidine synthase I [Methanocaldococcus infernus ME]|uniref:Phosphoribosylformylglycinamidine synthase subunit PurQ n=1 Tax=Methanocaldococcus infernus (strain DSM 11812 / JCM 15783 / ME) TaxID=573063 RepID=D5VRD8_METIM|nr:phosphoribosylformylglycinamidine synthase I [Methanocaldococcus infernus]ADG13141.1 phosphoribosylformylglycinamidine synthase I [Methanocaldococcus infernus ME]